MTQIKLGKMLGSDVLNSIEAVVDDALDLVTAHVSDGAFAFKSLTLNLDQPTVKVFQAPVKITAVASLAAKIAGPGSSATLFGETAPIEPPAGMSFVEFALNAKAGAAGEGGGNAGVLKISGEASATASLAYTHRIAVPGTLTRLEALQKLVSTSELPYHVKLKQLSPGESVEFSALLNFDFGLSAKYGKGFDFDEVARLTDNLAAPVKAHAEFSVSAALGFSLYDEVNITVAKAGQSNKDWVRIRFDRKHRDRITFGAAFNLAVDYDAAAGTKLLLDKIFALVPMPELNKTSREFLELFAAGNWAGVTTKISSSAEGIIAKLMDDAGWTKWAENDPKIQQLVKTSKWIVDTYSGLDEKIKSLWEQVLSRLDQAGLDHFRDLIGKIAKLDPNMSIQDLTSDQVAGLMDLIETLSGRDIEEMIISGSVRDAITRAVDAAKRLEALFAAGPSTEAIKLVHTFARDTGIEAVVDWLQKNTSSVEAIKGAADQWIKSVVERLVGKAIDSVSEGDRAALQQFAQRAQKLLNAPKDLRDKLKKASDKLKGNFGVSLSLEFSRLSEWSALVDMEVNPNVPAVLDHTSRFLPTGNVHQLLAKLDSVASDEQEQAFVIRELILTSRRVRSSARALFVSFLGMDKTGQDRIEESTVRVVSNERVGEHVGGAVLRRKGNGASSEGGAWVRYVGSSNKLAPKEPYVSLTSNVRIAYVRDDEKTAKKEVDAIVDILRETGFLHPGVAFNGPPADAESRFAVELEFADPALTKFTENSGKPDWNIDLLNAGIRWFGDKAATENDAADLLPILKHDKFREKWETYSPDDFEKAAKNGEFGPAFTLQGKFIPVFMFARQRSYRQPRFAAFHMPAKQTADAIAESCRGGAKMFASGGTEREPPLLNFFLVLHRLSRIAPQTLANATGLATFRWRTDKNSAWSAVQRFTLGNAGVPLQPAVIKVT